jgi:hypothetical protein
LAVVASAAVLSGCTAGEVVAADGSALTGYSGPSTVTFRNTSTDNVYAVSLNQSSSSVTFSFDPSVAQSATNGPYIPPGNYTLQLTLCTDATHCRTYGQWEGFTLAYNETCSDSYTGKSIPCALFKIVRCKFPADYNQYGQLCVGSSTSGGVTTVGVLDGP